MLFMNPLLLFAAAAAGGPLLIHLLLRNRPRRQVLPTMRFLPNTAMQTVAMHRFKNLLLLLLRVLAVLLIAAAFARPYLGSPEVAANGQQASAAVVFAVDASLSMRAGKRWSKALETVRAYASRMPAESPMALLFFDESPHVAMEGTADPAGLAATLDKAMPGYGATNLVAAMRAGASLGMKMNSEKRTVYFISDFQQSGFNQVAKKVDIGEDVEFVMVPVGEEPVWNASVTGLNEIETETGRKVRVQMESFGTGSASGTLAVSRDGKIIASRDVAFENAARLVEDIEISAKPEEEFLLSAVLTLVDGLAEDNTLTAHIAGHSPLPVVVSAPGRRVLAEDSSPGGYSDNPYLKAAVEAFGDKVKATWLEPARLGELSATVHPVAIVCGAESCTSAVLAHLKEYVESGGNLILFPDGESNLDQAASGSYPELCGVSVQGWKSLDRESGEYRLVTSHNTREALAGSEESDAASHLYPRAYRYLAVGVPGDVKAVQALMRYDDASPFLVEHALGAGNVFLCTTSLDPRASDLVLRPTFSPFLYQLVGECAQRSMPRASFSVGDVIPELLNSPDATLEAVDVAGGQYDTTADRGVLRQPGTYRLRAGDESRLLAVRLKVEESNLAGLDPRQILVSNEKGKQTAVVAGVNAEAIMSPPELDADSRFGHYLLIAALACMAAETLVASRTVR